MLELVLRQLRNWFVARDGVRPGTYTIDGGGLTLPFLQVGQYFRVIGSTHNDGVHQYPAALADETFDGAIWALAIPNAVLALVEEMEAWQERHGEAAASPYQSESFGGYTYAKPAGGDGASTLLGVFADRLSQWRKL